MSSVVYPLIIQTPSGVNTGTSTFTYSNAVALPTNQPVFFELENPGVLPAPLVADTTYYVIGPTATTFQLSLTPGGSAITVTTAGSGNMSLFSSGVAIPVPGGNYPTPPAIPAGPEAAKAGAYPAHRFNKRERKIVQSLVAYVNAQAGAAASTLATQLFGASSFFASLAGAGITNTGATTINSSIGSSPTTSITGFPPGVLTSGSTHANDTAAQTGQSTLSTALANLQSRTTTLDLSGTNLGGLTLTPGVYNFSSSAALTGTLTLDAQGNPAAQWIFKIGSTLTTASASSVVLVNSANPDNVMWAVGSSATLGTTTAFQGNIVASASITMNTGASITGRLWAGSGSITLADNAITL